jgi:hypothetical protein
MRAISLPQTLVALALGACRTAAPALDTTCPDAAPTPALVFHAMAGRGIPAQPDTLRLRVGGEDIVIGWKNLLSGRQLTLSCAYREGAGVWRLVHARLDDGTHALQVSARADPPALVYRDAEGRLLEVVELERLREGRWTSR